MGLIQIGNFAAECIVSALMAFFTRSTFIVRNLVGIGNENVSAMAGINNGVCSELKKDVPSLILINVLVTLYHWPCFTSHRNVYQGLFLLQTITTGFQILVPNDINNVTSIKPEIIIQYLRKFQHKVKLDGCRIKMQ